MENWYFVHTAELWKCQTRCSVWDRIRSAWWTGIQIQTLYDSNYFIFVRLTQVLKLSCFKRFYFHTDTPICRMRVHRSSTITTSFLTIPWTIPWLRKKYTSQFFWKMIDRIIVEIWLFWWACDELILQVIFNSNAHITFSAFVKASIYISTCLGGMWELVILQDDTVPMQALISELQEKLLIWCT